jgi:phage shock protein PspC (stress-responsive transcriptional regulator)
MISMIVFAFVGFMILAFVIAWMVHRKKLKDKEANKQ